MSLISAPLEEGLAFDTGPESVYAVQDYALANRKSVRVERASGADRRLVCSSEAPCGFFVQIYRQRMSDKKTYGKWYIASMQLTHSEICDSVRRLTTRQMAELPAFMAAVQANSKASIESLVALVEERHGVTLEKQIRLVYRARDLVRNGKAVVRSNILHSPGAPLPPRQYVRRHTREKKTSPEPKKPKNPERMAWTDILIESLLIERITRHGKQFVEAGEQSQHRDLWEIIHREFNAVHDVTVTVTQLRAKFRYLHEQYLRVRAEEDEATRDPDKLVVYPRCWDMMVEYFGDEMPHSNPSVDVDHEEGILTEANASQTLNMPSKVDNFVSVQSAPVPFIPSAPVQSIPMYSAPVQEVSQTQVPMTRQIPHPTVAIKRRRVNPSEAPAVPSSNAAPSDAANGVVEKLETIQSTQSDMARSMDGMKQVVEQSNEAIRGLQQALNQSNQVNAALLDFLRHQSPA